MFMPFSAAMRRDRRAAQSLTAAPRATPLAQFGFEGTGLPENTIVLFGHAFEPGVVRPGDPILLRRCDIATPLRTQMNVLSSWPDKSLKTVLMSTELPALADGQPLDVTLRLGDTHRDPGTTLSLTTLLSGRSATIRTWAPGNTTMPLWAFDPLAAISTDRWHEGPLAVSTRVEVPVPPSAIQNGRESVRLIVDIIATKDGFLELDVCFSNDRLPYTSQNLTAGGFANCGAATFGYTIEIDGVIVYDQRPASGVATTLLQYSQWIRRRGRNSAGTVIGWSSHRPFFRPDLAALVRAGVQQNYLTARAVDQGQIDFQINNHITAGAARETDPYWTWGLNRSAGAVGGRPEIGHRPFWGAVWLANGLRNAQLLSHRAFEAAATRPMYWRDWEEGDWLYPETWPRWAAIANNSSPLGTPKSQAIYTPQLPAATQSDHITVDLAHHGAFNVLPALLNGRRLAYDSMAARVAWSVMQINARHVPGQESPVFQGAISWRGIVTPNHTTGAAWGPRINTAQVRDQTWTLRCMIDAAVLLPDSFPFRERYNRHLEAWINARVAQHAAVKMTFAPELGVPFFHTGGSNTVNYMMHFLTPSLSIAQKNGVGGPNMGALIEDFARARVGWIAEPTFNHRNYMRGSSFAWRDNSNTQNAKTWADIHTFTINNPALGNTNEEWTTNPGEGDYVRNGNMNLAHLAYNLDLPLELRAMAADALVLCWSERIRPETGIANRPVSEPQNYYQGNFQTNAAWPPQFTSERNVAPTIPAGQSFTFRAGSPNGTVVGLVNVTGTLPRNSAPGRASADAFVIVSQPAGNPLSISPGGALRVANAAAVPSAPFTVQVYCRTWEQRNTTDTGIEHRSATTTVMLVPV